MRGRPIKTFAKKEEGATAPEYAIMIGLITGVIVVAVTAIGNALIPIFTAAAGMFGGS